MSRERDIHRVDSVIVEFIPGNRKKKKFCTHQFQLKFIIKAKRVIPENLVAVRHL